MSTTYLFDVTGALKMTGPPRSIASETLAGFAQACHHLDAQDRFADVVHTSEAVLANTRLSDLTITGLDVAVLLGRLGRFYHFDIDTPFAHYMIDHDPPLPELLAKLQDQAAGA